jgi:hypothetical protein
VAGGTLGTLRTGTVVGSVITWGLGGGGSGTLGAGGGGWINKSADGLGQESDHLIWYRAELMPRLGGYQSAF